MFFIVCWLTTLHGLGSVLATGKVISGFYIVILPSQGNGKKVLSYTVTPLCQRLVPAYLNRYYIVDLI